MSENPVLDLIQDPEQLRRIFTAQPGLDPEPPPREAVINLPEAPPAPPVVCNVEIRLRAQFDPWQIDRIPYETLKEIVWAVVTRDDNYFGGIVPELTFISMFLERTDPYERRSRQSVHNAPANPQRPDDRGDDDDDRLDRGGGDESAVLDGRRQG